MHVQQQRVLRISQSFSDGSNDAIYAFMSVDNFTHAAGKTCVAGQTSGDTDPKRGVYPNGDVSADARAHSLCLAMCRQSLSALGDRPELIPEAILGALVHVDGQLAL